MMICIICRISMCLCCYNTLMSVSQNIPVDFLSKNFNIENRTPAPNITMSDQEKAIPLSEPSDEVSADVIESEVPTINSFFLTKQQKVFKLCGVAYFVFVWVFGIISGWSDSPGDLFQLTIQTQCVNSFYFFFSCIPALFPKWCSTRKVFFHNQSTVLDVWYQISIIHITLVVVVFWAILTETMESLETPSQWISNMTDHLLNIVPFYLEPLFFKGLKPWAHKRFAINGIYLFLYLAAGLLFTHIKQSVIYWFLVPNKLMTYVVVSCILGVCAGIFYLNRWLIPHISNRAERKEKEMEMEEDRS
eukprot:gnl/Dysnectes_brevis/8408_a14911_311.p1 GENE.gnl/Dysnectes_brevis/8408_a14911_311~~gnl/Dysnectes_brevis/8408_a14911_311.p1  ORF type:complete len:304 (+),score=68.73 gnl/Dysnectes_brevis/8408_a14911_311:20-931(+)